MEEAEKILGGQKSCGGGFSPHCTIMPMVSMAS